MSAITVYLVPVGPDRYELYFEAPPDGPVDPLEGESASWWRRLQVRFRGVLAAAEADQRDRLRDEAPPRGGGLWRATLRKVAEAVAEQRLLWHLGRASAGRLLFPADLSSTRALELLRQSLRADFEKHRRWLVIDGLLALASAPLTVIPGPNIPALYFTFRVVGHYLSMRGASRGRGILEWETAASGHLTELREAIGLEPAQRAAALEAIAVALGLEHLPIFVLRMSGGPVS